MWAMEEFTMDDFDGRLIWERFGRRAARSYTCDKVRRVMETNKNSTHEESAI